MLRSLRLGALRAALIGVTMLTTTPVFADDAPSLEAGFDNPPQSARPRVWWHWMNGNVTIDGIDKDIDWMARIGIGGLQNFDANLATPQIVSKRLVYMEPEWKAAFRYAVKRADEKGLEFAIAASPGWSETGGPWVKPEDGMKKLVWSEANLRGGQSYKGALPAPPSVVGAFQSAILHDSHDGFLVIKQPKAPLYRDVRLLAYRTQSVALPIPKATQAAGTPVALDALLDHNLESTVALTVGSDAQPDMLSLDYGKAVTVSAATIFIPNAKPPFRDPLYLPVLETEIDGQWRKLGDFPLAEASTTIAFDAVTAQRFRLLLSPNNGPKSPGLADGAPGAIQIDIFAQPKKPAVQVGDFRLHGEAKIDRFEAKAGNVVLNDYSALLPMHSSNAIDPAKVIDLTSRLRADGTLDWTAPKGGDWRLLRLGYSLTGKTNHPATPEATGLEVDKYDAAAVRRYLETYLGMYRDVVGAEWMGSKGIQALLTDSIEVGAANWTPRMIEEFTTRRGYDPVPFLPALAGTVVGSAARSDAFLNDFRQTLTELMADAHYGTIAKVAHEHGLKVYGEALENGRPVLGDDLAMRAYADVPMAAMWTFGQGGEPRPSLLGDMKGAASVAHVYGQNIVAAESMTSAFAPWAFAPSDLKRIIDLEFAYGINRPVIHTSVHQPVDDKKPGLSLMIFGQYFNRHESWAEMAKPWVDYISRSSFMLQQGRNHADIAYFYGEESPVTGLFEFEAPKDLPMNYAYDFINANMLRDVLTVDGGEIVAKSGARYKALYLGGRSQIMTLGTLKRIAEMVDAGAMVVGQKPSGSPSLEDDAAEFSSLAHRLWDHPRVVASRDVEASLAKAGTGADFSYAKPQPDSEILFVHRKLADGDVYFLNNRQNRAEKIEARFRITGKQPELWNAITGKSVPLSFTVIGTETIVPMALQGEDAAFIVFRKPLPVGVTGASVAAPGRMQAAQITSPWSVAFEAERGAPPGIAMPTLKPLSESSDAGVKYFSGTATYTTSFTRPKKAKAGAPLWIDLGEVGDVAEVRVNGKLAGTVWFAPDRLDIGKLVKKGANTLEVRVANLWVNRLIGDKQPGATKVTFTAAPTYNADAPLRPSGLIGPVTLQY